MSDLFSEKELENYYRKEPDATKKAILAFLRDSRNPEMVVFGSQALNAHFPVWLDKDTKDWDVIAKGDSGELARQLESKLDRRYGGDFFCFPAKTRILVKKAITRVKNRKVQKYFVAGTKRIRDIAVGDLVLSFNGKNSKKEFKRVTRLYQRESAQFVVLRFSNGNEIECTPSHPIAVSRKGRLVWVSAENVKVGDKCVQYLYNGLRRRLSNMSMRNRTFADIFGMERAKAIGDKIRLNNSRSDPRKGLTETEYYGEKKAKRISSRKSKSHIGIPSWNRGLSKESNSSLLKIADTQKKNWGNPQSRYNSTEYRELRSQISAENYKKYKFLPMTITSLEKKISYVLRGLCPGEWRYNGDGRIMSIGNKIPDFVNVNGKKKVIECFSSFWKVKNHGSVSTYKEKRSRVFSKAGFETLFIEDKELNDKSKLKEHILSFVYNPCIELVTVVESRRENRDETNVYNLEVEDNNNYFAYGVLVHNCVEPAIHPGTFRIRSKVTGVVVADVSLKDREIKFKRIRGINYATLDWLESESERLIADPETQFRRNKDVDNLQRIKVYKRLKKQGRLHRSSSRDRYIDGSAVDTSMRGLR